MAATVLEPDYRTCGWPRACAACSLAWPASPLPAPRPKVCLVYTSWLPCRQKSLKSLKELFLFLVVLDREPAAGPARASGYCPAVRRAFSVPRDLLLLDLGRVTE